MGSMSLKKLGGLALIVGPMLAVLSYLIRPGGGIIGGTVDPADAAASIGVLLENGDLASISLTLIPIGLVIMLFGFRVLTESLSGSGAALSRLGFTFGLFGVVGWMIGSALFATIASGNSVSVAGALYAAGLGINTLASIMAAFGFVAITYGIYLNEQWAHRKTLTLVIVVVQVVLLFSSLYAGMEITFQQTAGMLGGGGYFLTVIWGILIGRELMADE